MLPLSTMKSVVAYQRDSDRLPLPPVDQMIDDAEAHIIQHEQQFASMEATVMTRLLQRSEEVLGALAHSADEMAAVDACAAANPQLENMRHSIADLRKIYEDTSQSIVETTERLDLKIQQQRLLKRQITYLQNQVKISKHSPGTAFLKEFGGKVAAYAANPQHPR